VSRKVVKVMRARWRTDVAAAVADVASVVMSSILPECQRQVEATVSLGAQLECSARFLSAPGRALLPEWRWNAIFRLRARRSSSVVEQLIRNQQVAGSIPAFGSACEPQILKTKIMLLNKTRSFLCSLCVLPILLSATAPAASASTNWNQISPALSPPARSYLAMAYDKASKKIVVFGGFDGREYLQDTWTFDGATWEKVETTVTPPARTNTQMAYDHRTRKIVLFGGYDGQKDLGDTWLWDGATLTWTQAAPAHSPKAVTGPMVFTDLNGRVDVFGGFSGNLYENTMWQWSGSDWRQLHPAQLPYARSSSAVGVDNRSKQIVLYGGLADVNPLNTWTYDGTTWMMESPAAQPLTVYGSAAAFEPNLDSVILFGGADGGVDQNTTWSWTESNWEQLFPAQSPPAREGFGMAWLFSADKLTRHRWATPGSCCPNEP
jgi:Galactose oxidase, central domain